MNRTDGIQAAARDIASNVHADPAMRDAMADALIKLCGLMIEAVGKHVACDGEADMNGWGCNTPGCDCRANGCDDERNAAHARYITGERIQDGARWAAGESSNPNVDLERWTRPTPGDGCRCGHVPSVHQGGVCTGEQYNREACQGGPCTGFVRREPTGGWRHVDRRPVELRGESYPELVIVQLDGCGVPQQPLTLTKRCPECNRLESSDHKFGCSKRYPGRCDAMAMNGGRCTKNAGHFSQSNLHTFG